MNTSPQKPETGTIKVWAIALCRSVFQQAQDSQEFQRQVVNTTLSKFIGLLVSMAKEGCSHQLLVGPSVLCDCERTID